MHAYIIHNNILYVMGTLHFKFFKLGQKGVGKKKKKKKKKKTTKTEVLLLPCINIKSPNIVEVVGAKWSMPPYVLAA